LNIEKIELMKLSIPQKNQKQEISSALSISLKELGFDRMTSRSKSLDVLVSKITTNEGVSGLGEIVALPPLTRESPDEIMTFVKTWVGPRLLGQDPFNLNKIWEIMDKISYVGVCSKGIIDMALYDVMGKALKTPVYNLLGGLSKERFPVIKLIYLDKPELMAETAENMVEIGYKGARIKVGQPGNADLNVLHAIREKVGWDFGIRVDANQAWSVPKAIKHIKAMEKYDLEFVEQPVIWYDLKGMAKVRKKVDVPITAHESMYTLQDVDNLIKLDSMDVIGVKAYRPGGGLTGTIKVLDLAEIMNIPCYLHSSREAGICTAASTHIVAAKHHQFEYTAEISSFYQYESELVTNPVKIEGGYAEVPKLPGLGVELDEKDVKQYLVNSVTVK
jgi:L-alanine-DL-glutamate epimerase-like enolase superfamily enzyme